VTTSSQEETVDAEAVWREFGGSVRAFVRRRVADPDRADDVVSEVLVRVLRGLHTLQDPQRVTAWILQIARNAIIDEYRRTARQATGLTSDDTALPVQPAADAWVDDQDELLRELASCMRPLLAQLPAHYRRALELTDLQQLTQAQAARLEGVSTSGMKSRVQRGRLKLTELLERCCALTLDGRGLPLMYDRPPECSCG
jgi:RNA polymerase sigma-70 factor, ECF subfamily